MSSTTLSKHVFVFDGNPSDYNGRRYCTCGLIETHPRHDVPQVSDDEREAEARLLGEHEE